MTSALDRVVAFAVADDSDHVAELDAGDTAMLVQATDAAIDEACRLFREVDTSSLPPQVKQALALMWAAQSVVDGLIDSLGLDDPDDELSDYAKMTGNYTILQWQRLELAGKTKEGGPLKPYGDVHYADPGYQADGKKRYPIDTESHVRAAWTYINVVSNQKGYTSDQLAKVKGAIKAAGKRLGISYSEDS